MKPVDATAWPAQTRLPEFAQQQVSPLPFKRCGYGSESEHEPIRGSKNERPQRTANNTFWASHTGLGEPC